MSGVILKDFSWERMIAAVEDVRERACRAAGTSKGAGIPHVIVGGHAVAAWVARVDKEAVRNTKMKLTSFRLKDKVHLMDLLDVGLIDQGWCDRLPSELGIRLEELIDERERER